MLLPSLRKRLRTVSGKNQSLQDILRTTAASLKAVSIEPATKGIHNTKLTLQLLTGEQRVHFYNRLPLENVIVGLTITSNDLDYVLTELNLQGCDFTEDDLIVVEGWLEAKPESIGYIGKLQLKANTIPIPNDEIFVAFYLNQPRQAEAVAVMGGIKVYINDVLLPNGMDDVMEGAHVNPFAYFKEAVPGNPIFRLLSDIPYPLPPLTDDHTLVYTLKFENKTQENLKMVVDMTVGNDELLLLMIPYGSNPTIKIDPENRRKIEFTITPSITPSTQPVA